MYFRVLRTEDLAAFCIVFSEDDIGRCAGRVRINFEYEDLFHRIGISINK